MKTSLRVALVGAGAVSALCVSSVQALDFHTASLEGSLNSTLTFSGGLRTGDPSCSIVGDSAACGGTANPAQWSAGDDGDLNYRAGDFFTLALKGNHELLVKNPDNGLKLFARGTWKEDFEADDTRRTDLSSGAKHQIVNNIELLDLWISKDFSWAGQNGRIRVGNQVTSWGEALFYIGGIQNNVLDFQKLLVPGTQLKEAYLPVPAISVSSTLGNTLSVEAVYQITWRRTRVAPVGSYFSASDTYNKGRVPVSFSGQNFNVTGQDQYSLTGARQLSDAQALAAINGNGDFGVPILGDRTPKNSGQFGLSMKWAPEGSQVNFGAYVENYHDQFPVLNLVESGTAYQWSFRENRQVYGLTSSFPLGNWAIGTELSYRPRDAVALSGCYGANGPLDANTNTAVVSSCPLWKDNQKYQASVTGLLQLQKSEDPLILGLLHADTAFLTVESALTEYPGANHDSYRTIDGVAVKQVAAAGYFVPLDKSDPANPVGARLGTATSWGYIADFNWTYDATVIPGWQLTPGLTFSHNVHGDTPNYSAQFLQGNMSLNGYLLLNQNPAKWQLGMNYTSYFGGKNDVVDRQYYKDRDFLGFFVSYSF